VEIDAGGDAGAIAEDAAIADGAVSSDGAVDAGGCSPDLNTDEANCGACGNVCQAIHGSNTCEGGVCVPQCDPGFASCDPSNENGCEQSLMGDAVCVSAIDLGAVISDTGSATLGRSGYGGAWYRVTLKESLSGSTDDLTAAISLQSPPGMDYEFKVYCAGCGTSFNVSSSSGPGLVDSASIRVNDTIGANDLDLWIEIVFASGDTCALWDLTIAGNSGGTTDTVVCVPSAL
jgi:hypothetical protein